MRGIAAKACDNISSRSLFVFNIPPLLGVLVHSNCKKELMERPVAVFFRQISGRFLPTLTRIRIANEFCSKFFQYFLIF